jgi:hypothetical protein
VGWKFKSLASRVSAIENTLRMMQGKRGRMVELKADAQEIAAVSRVMACAAWYRALVDRQRVLVRRLERYAAGERELVSPRIMADRQDAIREDLERLVKELERRVAALPPGYTALGTSALDFIAALHELDIPSPMMACSAAARNERGREAWNHARQALEKMEELISRCKGGGFGGMCDGKLRFSVPGDLSTTMAQMLKSLMQQFASGVGRGAGVGSAGIGLRGVTEGSRLGGYSALNVPVYGPERWNPFASTAMGRTGRERGAGRGRGLGRRPDYHEAMRARDKQRTAGTGIMMDSVPARYRDAVKTFYSEED